MRDDYDMQDEREREDDLSMDRYFDEGLSEDIEENNPFEQPVRKKRTKKSPAKSAASNAARSGLQKLRKNFKIVLFALGIVAVLVIVIIVVSLISKRNNDGKRFALQLSDSINLSLDTAMQTTGFQLDADSQFPSVNQIFSFYNYKLESKKDVVVQNVTLPQWLILCERDGSNLQGVLFYDFRVLEDNVFGVKRKGYLDPNTVQQGMTADEAEAALDMDPYCIHYLGNNTQQRDYRYCYKDGETGNLVSYTITVALNPNGSVTGVTDARGDYMSGLLMGTK